MYCIGKTLNEKKQLKKCFSRSSLAEDGEMWFISLIFTCSFSICQLSALFPFINSLIQVIPHSVSSITIYILSIFYQDCDDTYRIAYTLKARRINQQVQQTYRQRSFAGCFNTGVYDDVKMAGTFTQFSLTMRKLHSYISIGELEVYIGQDDPSSFQSGNLQQDGPRTWLVFKKQESYDLDVLDIRENAHLAIQNDALDVSVAVKEYKGDFTGTLHIGSKQFVDLSANENTVIPFSIRAYSVSARNTVFSALCWDVNFTFSEALLSLDICNYRSRCLNILFSIVLHFQLV